MKQFGFFHPFYMAFYSKALYRDVALNWRGTCFGYLFVLLLFSWLLFVVKFHLMLVGFVDKNLPVILEKVPPITIKDGKVSVDAKQPYFINSKDGQPIAILDTTGQYKSLDNTRGYVLLTDSALIIRKSPSETQTVDLSRVKEFSFQKSVVRRWVDFAVQWAAPLFFLLALPFSFAYRIVQTLLYAAIGTAFVSSLRGSLPFSAVLRLAVMAVTPVIVLDTVILLAGVEIPFVMFTYWPLCIGIALVYLYQGVKAALASPPPEAGMPEPAVEVIPGGFDRPQ